MWKKRGFAILSTVTLIFGVTALHALDLILKDGKVLHHVTVVNILHNGVQINADRYGNGSDITTRMVRYTELTDLSLDRLKKELDKRALILHRPLPFPQYPVIRANAGMNPVRSRRTHIRFDSDGMLMNGSIGWAHEISRIDPLNTFPLGRVYVYGLLIPQGGNWYGTVYPADRNIVQYDQFYRCWAMTPWTAKKLAYLPFAE